MDDIVIVGAGPLGLYIAIRLKQLGVQNVILIDPRAGEYYRPGFLVPAVYKGVEKRIGLPIHPSLSHHIKDLERSLWEIAKSLNVDIRQEKFLRFSNKKITVLNIETYITSDIDCDIAIDATGSSRVLVNAVNDSEKDLSPIFSVTPIFENPIKNHFIAYVEMQPEDVELLSLPLSQSYNPLLHTLALENLRENFGWSEFAEPSFYYHILNKGKVCLYFETPLHLQQDQQRAWLKALLQLKTGKEDISFDDVATTHERKRALRFSPFVVNPHKVTPACYAGDEHFPMVLPIGDAQVDPDYRKRMGISSGMDRVEVLLDSMTIDSGKVVAVDLIQYEELVAPLLVRHEKAITALYTARQRDLVFALEREKDRYTLALKATDNIVLQEKIMSGLNKICHSIAMNYYHEAKELIKNVISKTRQFKSTLFGQMVSEAEIIKCKKLLTEAMDLMQSLHHPDEVMMRNTLLGLAVACQQISEKLLSLDKPVESQKFYKISKEILEGKIERPSFPKLDQT